MSRDTLRGITFPANDTISEIQVTADGELLTTDTNKELNVLSHFIKLGISADAYYILVDHSDTTNFPHTKTGAVHASYIKIDVDKPVNALGSVSIGTILRVDGTDADIAYLTNTNFLKNGDTKVLEILAPAPAQYKFDVVGGALTKAITNLNETNVAAVNTGTTLESPRGASTVTPAVGDVIIKVDYLSGSSFDLDVEFIYHDQE